MRSLPEGSRHGEDGGEGQHIPDEAHCAHEENRQTLKKDIIDLGPAYITHAYACDIPFRSMYRGAHLMVTRIMVQPTYWLKFGVAHLTVAT